MSAGSGLYSTGIGVGVSQQTVELDWLTYLAPSSVGHCQTVKIAGEATYST